MQIQSFSRQILQEGTLATASATTSVDRLASVVAPAGFEPNPVHVCHRLCLVLAGLHDHSYMPPGLSLEGKSVLKSAIMVSACHSTPLGQTGHPAGTCFRTEQPQVAAERQPAAKNAGQAAAA